MDVKSIMTTDVQVIHPETTIQEAAKTMDDRDIGCLLVCDGDRLQGVITDRDIVIRSISAGQDPNVTSVRDAMTEPVIYCYEDQDVNEAAQMMEEKQVRRLPVLNRSKRLVGICTIGDIAVDAHDERLAGEVLERVSEPSKAA